VIFVIVNPALSLPEMPGPTCGRRPPTRMWRTLAALDEAISVSLMEHLQKRIAVLEQKVGAGSEPPRNQMESKPGRVSLSWYAASATFASNSN
jgi:hypothetical protein